MRGNRARAVVFAAACIALAPPASAQIDMTGRWLTSGDIGIVESACVQDGTALSCLFGDGSIDPWTGVFHTERSPECSLPGDDGPSTIDGTVSPDGLTFDAVFSVLVVATPSNPCVRFDGGFQGTRVGLQTIAGKAFVVRNAGGGATRRITVSAKEKNSDNTLIGDPTKTFGSGGAVLQIFAKGGTPSTQKFPLPQGTRSDGQPFWSGSAASGFHYKDPRGEQGPVRAVIVKHTPGGSFSIKAKVKGGSAAVSVAPPNPGTEACAALDIGIEPNLTGDRYSIQFGTDSTVKNGATFFKARRPGAEGHCVGTL